MSASTSNSTRRLLLIPFCRRTAVTRRSLSTVTPPRSAPAATSPDQTAPTRRPVYVAATRQHVGKTSVSLALLSGLQKRFNKVGFIKPVGQQSLPVTLANGETVVVDKDAALVKDHFMLDHLDYRDTSPLLIPKGYTRDYLDGKITAQDQRETVMQAFDRINNASEIVLCEGTGHCAVGTIVDASNAAVASWLGSPMVLVANGGLGKCIDELELNRSQCAQYGVKVAGVIINKVQQDKYEQTKEYVSKALEQRWGIPLLGCIPDRPFLGCPALKDLERLLDASLVSGQQHRLRHYRNADLDLVATSLDVFLKRLRNTHGRTLYLCHASRTDILVGFLMQAVHHQKNLNNPPPWEHSVVVTGCEEYPISSQVLEMITSLVDAPPVLLTPFSTDRVMEQIYSYTPKLNKQDGHRVATTVDHYEPYIDFDLLLERVGYFDDDSFQGMASP